MWIQSNSSLMSPAAAGSSSPALGLDVAPRFLWAVLRERTRFIYASASFRRPLKVRPCLVSMINSIPIKCLSSGARCVSVSEFGFALFVGLFSDDGCDNIVGRQHWACFWQELLVVGCWLFVSWMVDGVIRGDW